MSIEISLRDLAKSQLLTLKGEVVSDSSPPGGKTLSAGAKADQKEFASRLQNSVIDNKYKIISLLGMGGMGAVYKAHHLRLNKDVALKTFLSPNLTDDSWQRFQREAKAIASLSHKNIVQVFDFGVGENNVPYYTMEYLTGESLAERLARVGPLPLDQTLHLFVQVCQALSVAHQKGIIHRDIKPANIFLVSQGSSAKNKDEIKLVDFGVASLANRSMEDQKLTSAGTIFGSPLYMSPEQSLGQPVDVQSDIYSVGCSLFETITGSPPFRGDTALATMLLHQQSPLPEMSKTATGQVFPQRLKALLTKMLAKDPQARCQSILEVNTELQAISRLCSPAMSTGATALDDLAGSDQAKQLQRVSTSQSTKSVQSWVAAAVVLFLAGGTGLYLSQHRWAARPTKSLEAPTHTAPQPACRRQ